MTDIESAVQQKRVELSKTDLTPQQQNEQADALQTHLLAIQKERCRVFSSQMLAASVSGFLPHFVQLASEKLKEKGDDHALERATKVAAWKDDVEKEGLEWLGDKDPVLAKYDKDWELELADFNNGMVSWIHENTIYQARMMAGRLTIENFPDLYPPNPVPSSTVKNPPEPATGEPQSIKVIDAEIV